MTANISDIDLLAIRVSDKTIWTFVRAVDLDGTVGWGEATLAGRELDLVRAHSRYVPALIGTSADPRRNLMRECSIGVSDKPAAAIASALDQALWDIDGRHKGRPIHNLLSQDARPTVGIYANINRRTTDRSSAGFAESARKALADGYDAVKIAPFDGVRPGDRHGIAEGIARATAVREAIGPGCKLMVDCHWRFDESTATFALSELARLDLHWFECPIAETSDNFDALRRLRRRANDFGALQAGCEMETCVEGFQPFVEGGVYDVVMPDIKYAGGLLEFGRIAEMAKGNGVFVAPHNPSGPISHAASLHLSATLPGFLSLEHQYDESPLFYGIVKGQMPAPVRGASPLPTGNGLGIEPDALQLTTLDALLRQSTR